jgi:acyl-CoA synthetase (AMP-forming)/AMP-acid ligase II
MQLAQFGASTALIDGDGAQSYSALDDAANAVASVLVRAGVRPGSVVVTLCPAGRWWLAGTYGVWRAGAVLLPLEASHPPAELRHPVTDSGVTHVLCTAESARNLR